MHLCGDTLNDVQEIRECVYYMIEVAFDRIVREKTVKPPKENKDRPDTRPKHPYPPISYEQLRDPNVLPYNAPVFKGNLNKSFPFRVLTNY